MDLKSAVSRVFQAYDMRGLYPQELTPQIAFRVGRALAAYLEEAMRVETGRVVVGRDMRLGSESMAHAVAHGLEVGGITPVDVGLVSTDVIYFVTGEYPDEFDAGVMITASHNPPRYNGLKFVLSEARSICANTGLNIIRDIVIARNDGAPEEIPAPALERRDVFPAYLERLFSIAVEPIRPHKIVVDAGNGMAGAVFPRLAERLPCEIIPLNFELDGTFPAHRPDPSDPRNLQQLRAAVLDQGAHLGIAFDGDADRVAMVDECGQPVSGSLLTGLFAQVMLKRHPGQKVLFDLTSGLAVEDCVREAGGEPMVAPVGHSRIKERMRKVDALFAGEQSGHYYFRDFYYCDSGMLAALLALELLSATDQPLSALLEPLRQRYYRAPNVNLELADHQAVLDGIRRADEHFADDEARRVTRIGPDVRKDYADWWFCLHPSGTEPRLLRLTVEARDPEAANARMDELQRCVLGA
ncbi:MAG: phosphomannomutase/phosphoglucomutase [Candidatus Brocadiia bacterium]